MPKIYIHKAQAIHTGVVVEDCEIVIDNELPDFGSLPAQDAFTQDEAERIEQALFNSLPGTTYDRLLVAMLARTASHLRVSHH